MPKNALFPVVGIGASAGGLRALEDFFKTIPPDPGMAFVVVTHLAPDRHSYLTDILARHTSLAVQTASDGLLVQQNSIYVLPPHAILTMNEGQLRLQETPPDQHDRNPIDVFFGSLAMDCADYAVGVVLSGSGTDGVLGVKAIKEQGGLVLAQAPDASGPSFAGMPDSAIASGLVDFAVPVDAMAAKLLENARSFSVVEMLAGERSPSEDEGANIEAREEIYKLLRIQTGHDFSSYKIRTFIRRVQRRMQVNHCETLLAYVAVLQQQPDETNLLFRDLLINVTSFFRDPEAFDALEKMVIPRLFEGRGAADSVRVWVPGCATGEEVISIAILLREHMNTLHAPPRVTIFATDIDESALAIARASRYPAAVLEGVSAERRKRFFTSTTDGFVVAKSVRDLCVFSPHNVLRDPPFSRMDLISCRNLLIYFAADAQRQLMPLFHYALRPNAFLFLGKSESIGRFSELFAAIDKKNCVFQAIDTGSPARMPIFVNGLRPAPFTSRASDIVAPEGGVLLRQTAETRIAERFGPPHVVVDEEGDVVHYSTRTGKYLEAPYGVPTRQLLTIARRELRLELRAALRAAIETRRPSRRDDIEFDAGDHRIERVSLGVEPLTERQDGHALYLVTFEDSTPADADKTPATGERAAHDVPGGAAQLELELRDTRDRLQGTIEEYETALEELKSTNEELISLNEEMQSSNEELESTKEELQSLNEELQTVNVELELKVDDLDRANADLTNLFASTNVATIFLDRRLVIRSFTPAVSQLFNVIATDRGRPLGDLAIKLDYPELQADISSVLSTGEAIERRVHRNQIDAPYFLARVTPYRDAHQAIDGVVATFVDVTNLAKSEERQRSLVSELNHRVKNMLTVVMAIALQTLPRAASPKEFTKIFISRLHAMSRSHELLSRENWGDVGLEDIIRQGLIPYFPPDPVRIAIAGPPVTLPARIALSISTIIEELATNAVKYGALSNELGRIAIDWSVAPSEAEKRPMLTLNWRESGGPNVTMKPKIAFGVKAIKREVEYTHSGVAHFDFTADGLTASFEIPLQRQVEIAN